MNQNSNITLRAKRLILINLILVAAIWTLAYFRVNQDWVLYLNLVTLFSIAIQFLYGVVLIAKFKKIKTGLVAFLSSPVFAFFTIIPLFTGAAWGRPLRIKGKQIHADLTEGLDWSRGEKPSSDQLDPATRLALETLWLHDAQKEHASVPAFSRISWILTAAGAPAYLIEWSHRAAIEEIEHTRLCFALAAGYGRVSHGVKPMPQLLRGGLDVEKDPLITLAKESLSDGCQLEDFNADVAAACARICEEPVTKSVLMQIAREERSHADFSWSLLAWTLNQNPNLIRPEIEKTLANLDNYQRPTAVGHNKINIVAAADPIQLRKHGRLSDLEWGRLWQTRLSITKERIEKLLTIKLAA